MAVATVDRSSAISSAFAGAHDEIDSAYSSDVEETLQKLKTSSLSTQSMPTSSETLRPVPPVARSRPLVRSFTTMQGMRAIVPDELTAAQARMLEASSRLRIDDAGRCWTRSRHELLYGFRQDLFDEYNEAPETPRGGSPFKAAEVGVFTNLHNSSRDGPRSDSPGLYEMMILRSRQMNDTPGMRLRIYRNSLQYQIEHDPRLARRKPVLPPGALRLSRSDEEPHDPDDFRHEQLVKHGAERVLGSEIATGLHHPEWCTRCAHGCRELGSAAEYGRVLGVRTHSRFCDGWTARQQNKAGKWYRIWRDVDVDEEDSTDDDYDCEDVDRDGSTSAMDACRASDAVQHHMAMENGGKDTSRRYVSTL
ncbi:hypothetical protein LTR86_004623 [Recurvomyces mirabilis]|nr:hypothetical protein LTR86_004623 [Recurvomyces mirabilis]